MVYDEAGLSWTKRPLPIEHCLSVVDRMDTEGKVILLPGNFHDTGLLPLEAETLERNAGHRRPGTTTSTGWCRSTPTRCSGAPGRFVEAIARAHSEGRSALDYPARWLYGHVGGQIYLERCRRTWGISAGYPGPMAVKAGTTLRLARQCDVPIWRIDFRRRNTDPAHPRDARVDELVRPDEGIWHFSWVRSEKRDAGQGRLVGPRRRGQLGQGDRPLAGALPASPPDHAVDPGPPAARRGRGTDLVAHGPGSGLGRGRRRMSTPTASVVIITYQRPDFVTRCLEHLLVQTVPPSEIIVVDSSSDDETERLVRDRFPTVTYAVCDGGDGGDGHRPQPRLPDDLRRGPGLHRR